MALKLKFDAGNIPKPVKIAIAVGIPVIIALLFFFLYYKPASEEIKMLKGDIARQEQEIARAETKLKRLPEVKALYETLLSELNELKQQLPEEKEVSNLLKQVSDLGIQSGLIIRLWRPANRKVHKSDIVYEIPVQVEMTGSYHRLGRFFSSLTSLKRIVNISDIRLGGAVPSGKEAELNISFNAVTFSAIPEEELKK